MIRSPGTKTMAPQTPALPLELSLRPLMVRVRSTPQISITMAIWMCFPHQQAMIRSSGTKTMAQQTPALPLELSLRPQMALISVYAADIDNDGDMDMFSASYNDDKIAWYENDGAADPSFTPRTISTSADGAHSVYATDIDSDGDMDVLSASYSDDKIAWYENDGAADPSFTARTISTSADGASSVYAADYDNDGDMDVLSAS